LGLPHSSGLCDSAGATAGMASLAACSTGADTLVRPYTARHWVEQRGWVKGPQAGWKAGRRLESLPHIGHDMEGTGKTNYREHGEGKPQRGIAATKQVWRHKKSSRAEKNLRASSTEGTEDTEKNKPPRTRRWKRGGGHAGRHPCGGGLRWSAQSCGPDGVSNSRTSRDCVALPA